MGDDGKTIKHDEILYGLWKNTWSVIDKNYETNKTRATKGPGNIVSFEAFLDYVSRENNLKGGLRGDHWFPIYRQCNACLINYNVIAKIETVSQDTEYIQKKLKAEAIGSFPNAYKNTEMDYKNYEDNLKILYKGISREVMDRVCEKWKWDFLLF